MQKQFLTIKFDTKIAKENGYFKGYASVFNNLDNNNDIIMPNAFIDLDVKEVRFLWQHDATQPIGKILNLYQDKKGLVVEGQITLHTGKGREVSGLLKDDVVEGLSIGFEVKDYFNKGLYRYITKIKLWEVSVVTFPANTEAKILEVKASNDVRLSAAIKRASRALEGLLEYVG